MLPVLILGWGEEFVPSCPLNTHTVALRGLVEWEAEGARGGHRDPPRAWGAPGATQDDGREEGKEVNVSVGLTEAWESCGMVRGGHVPSRGQGPHS